VPREDTFRFLAATNGTRVAINGKIVASLDRGQFYEQIIDGPAEILASKPILVAQYANGSDFDGTTGDPFMMLIPPFEQFGGDYILSTAMATYSYEDPPRLVYTNNYINLTVRTNGAGTILLDDVPVPADCFQLIGNSGYAGAQIPVNPGVHHLSAPVPFGACVYGWAFYESYAFMGGFYSETIESDTRLELTQPTPFAAVGHEKNAVARVTNGRGFPLPDVEVSFAADGANAATGRAITSRFGDAIFSYTGANAGVDVITATLVDLKQSVTNTWLASSDNAPPIVSTADTQPVQFSLTAQLNGTVSDDGRPAGTNLNVHWFFLGGPGDVQFEDATQPSTRAFCSEPGTYQFELNADDSQFSSRAMVNVTVGRPFPVELSGVEPGTWFSTNASISLSANIDSRAIPISKRAISADSRATVADTRAIAINSRAIATDSRAIAIDSHAIAIDRRAIHADNRAIAADMRAIHANSRKIAIYSLRTGRRSPATTRRSLFWGILG
jgi:hypothetical protein